MKKLALIGCGYWGRNYVNTIRGLPDLELKYLCEISRPKIHIPEGTQYTDDFNLVLKDKDVEGVMIVTPTKTHYNLANTPVSDL